MIALVAGPTAASAASRSMRPVPGSESIITGVAPVCSTALADATKVIVGTSTSSPGPIPSTRSASISAAVHDDRHRASATPVYSLSISSKRWTFGPVPTHPDRRHATTSAISSSPINGLPKTKNSSRIGLLTRSELAPTDTGAVRTRTWSIGVTASRREISGA